MSDPSKPTPARRIRASVAGKSRLVHEIGDSSEASERANEDASSSSDDDVITVSAQPFRRQTEIEHERDNAPGPSAAPTPSKKRQVVDVVARNGNSSGKTSVLRRDQSPKARNGPSSPRVISRQREAEAQERLPASPMQARRPQYAYAGDNGMSEETSAVPDIESLRIRILSLEAIVKKKDKQIEKV